MIYATHYSLQMPDRKVSIYYYYPTNWKLYGISSDGEQTIIDTVTNTTFNTNHRTKTFEIENKGY